MDTDRNRLDIRRLLVNRQGLSILISLVVFFLYIQFISLGQERADLEAKAKEHYRLGQIYYEHGLNAEAEAEFQRALDTIAQVPRKAAKEELADQAQPPAQLRQEPSASPTVKIPKIPSGNEYIISAGDVLFVSVWENPDLTQEVIVRPDGKISFPLIDEVQAQGFSISQLDKDMTQKLKEFIHYPDVSISLRKMSGERVIILGEVKAPGVYSLQGRKTVIEAVALAGGFTRDAVLNSVIIVQGGFENPKAKRINLVSVLRKGKAIEDVGLNAQDIVYVPRTFISNLGYFLKQILDPISRGVYTATQMDNF